MSTELLPADLEPYLAQPSPAAYFLAQLFGRKSAPVIFDIGACEGEDSIRYSRLFPRARQFAFEPLPGNQEIIRTNFAKYGVVAELVPVALSDRDGTATFHVSDGMPPDLFSGKNWNYSNKSSSLLPPVSDQPMHGWIRFPKTITVPCQTFDAFCGSRGLDRVDFIHLDVQGAEGMVLAGARRMLPQVTAIWLEAANREIYRGQKLRGEIETLLRDHGFVPCFETFRPDGEGEQFYINRRKPRTRRVLIRRRIQAKYLQLRSRLSHALRAVGCFHFLHDLRRDWRAGRRARTDLAKWESAGRPSPPPPIVKQRWLRDCARRHHLTALIETGTFYGDTIFALRRQFQEIHSIELSPQLHREAVEALGHLPHVHLYAGDSARVLPEILPRLDRPALFWLDGHFSGGPTAQGDLDSPVVAELKILFGRPPGRDMLLIDDAREFTGRNGYPTLEEIRRTTAEQRPQAEVQVQDDIIRIFPV